MVGPWMIVIGLLTAIGMGFRFEVKRQPVIAAAPAVSGNAGAWGKMEYHPLQIDLPDEFVLVPPPNQPPVRWCFHGFSKDQAIEFIKSSSISPQQQAMLEKAVWQTGPNGIVVEPGDELILSLAPDARAAIYARLNEFGENSQQIEPVCFEKGRVDERLKESGLSAPSVALLKSLLYPRGPSLLLFTDFDTALRHLPNDQERRLFANAVSRKKTLLAVLSIGPDANVDAIVDYWGVGGRKKDVGPLLRALQREGESKINIVCLLPQFGREHLYTYPLSTIGAGPELKQDCFWSAMNFFNDPPDNRVNDRDHLRELLKNDYAQIAEPTQLGDLIFLMTTNKSIVHAAVHVADDIVFTKNGDPFTQPWILMRKDDMMQTYDVKYPTQGPLQAVYYRKKSMF
jgi:hypothetical protein